MVEKVKGRMAEMRFPKFLANLFTKKIPGLQRWRSKRR
jgi:hypothetical protein